MIVTADSAAAAAQGRRAPAAPHVHSG